MSPENSPIPQEGGSYALVNGKLVRLPEDDQQLHQSDSATTDGAAAASAKTAKPKSKE